MLCNLDRLSPRARGELGAKAHAEICRRTIPACTGGTARPLSSRGLLRDYPRVHGGNVLMEPVRHDFDGLSPRARGEHINLAPPLPVWGTIPACTGGTVPSSCPGCPQSDYPRVHGGNLHLHFLLSFSLGLSPRARGERSIHSPYRLAQGTIPACTGGTYQSSAASTCVGDYPRVHGGNLVPGSVSQATVGLSPRARGERQSQSASERGKRTIPACTGGT